MIVYVTTYVVESYPCGPDFSMGGLFKTEAGAYKSLPFDDFEFKEFEPEKKLDGAPRIFKPTKALNENAKKMFTDFIQVEISSEEVQE